MTTLEIPQTPYDRACSHHNITVVYHNIQSLQSHFNDLKRNMDSAAIIGLSETRIIPNSNIQPFMLDTFHSLVHADRPYGGVAFYIKSSLDYKLLPVPDVFFDCLAVEITHPHLIVVVIYNKPHGINRTQFISELSLVVQALPSNVHTVIGGDFNINILKDHLQDSHPLNLYKQLITEPTTSAQTLLDPIFVSLTPTNYDAGVSRTYYSFHDAVFYAFSSD